MIERIFAAALQNRLMTMIAVLVVVGFGLRAMMTLPIDAVPDVTPNVVQIVTKAPGLAPPEVEKFITFPVEVSMRGLPGITEIRSTSAFGLSAVWVYFTEKYDIYFARRLIMERLPAARELIPAGYGSPEMLPVSTALGEIFQFQVTGPNRSLMELRSILDWEISPQLKSIPGVVEVNSFGGELKTFELQLDPNALVAYGISLEDVFHALQKNNAATGGGYLSHGGQQEIIRGSGLIQNLSDIELMVVGNRNGVPIYVRNLGKVEFAPRIRQGAVTRDGKGEIVSGVVMMLIGENSRVVVERVKKKIAEMAPRLPAGVEIRPYYDRASLITRTISTVVRNLVEGALLVTVILFLFLGDVRASLICAAVIPLSMLVAFIGMNLVGVSGNLMSLGAIDFGLIVDGSVVMIENIFRRLGQSSDQRGSMSHRIFEAGREVLRPIVFAIGIIIIVYLPILTFENVEGKMFRPMAYTVIFALAGSLLCALTLVPVLASLLIKKVSHGEPWLARMCDRAHASITRWVAPNPRIALGICAAVLVGSFALAPFLGSAFIPTLDEGSLNLDVMRIPSISLDNSIINAERTENVLKAVPEVTSVVSRIGHSELATDTMGPDESDVYVFLKPQDEWRFKHREQLVTDIEQRLKHEIPENRFSFSQPIENRLNDMIAGIKGDVAIHVYGDDFHKMLEMGHKILDVVSALPGAADGKIAPRTGLPDLNIEIDRPAVARYGINVSDVLDAIETLGGRVEGQVVEGNARYLLQVRFAKDARSNIDQIDDIKIAAPDGKLIPLAQLASFTNHEGPVSIWRENLSRRVSVAINVRGTDLGTFVASAQKAIADKIELPHGWWLEWGGQYENLQRASHRLMLLVPISLLLILVLLYNTFTSMRTALLIFGNVLIGASGGIFALAIRGLVFSITAGVGFVTLFGVSVLNGVVLVSEINRLRETGMRVDQAVTKASRDRLRPILMASMVALFGFIPMAISSHAGAEVQRPLATVVIGGLLTSTSFTLYILPMLYRWMIRDVPEKRQPDNLAGAS
jgi:cobalt-zinc-cadmium resistance protein CzcA